MSALSKVIRFEVVRTLKKKSFWLSALAIPFFGLVVSGIVYFSDHSSSKTAVQTTKLATNHASIAVLDQSGLVNPTLLSKVHARSVSSVQAGITAVRSQHLDAFLYYPKNVTTAGVQVYSHEKSLAAGSYNTLATQLLQQSALLGVSAKVTNSQIISALQSAPTVHVTNYKNGLVSPGAKAAVLPGIIAVLFLVLLILSANQMITSVTEEKENRVAEILLTSIESRALVIGKIASIAMVGFVQLLVIIAPLVIVRLILFSNDSSIFGIHISLSGIPVDVPRLLLSSLYAFLGFILFTGLLVGIGAMSPSAKEAGPFVALTYIWTYSPSYALGLMISTPQNVIVQLFTFFPLTSPMTALLRNAIGNLSLFEVAITLPVLALMAGLATVFAVKAFRAGAMEYTSRLSPKNLLR